MFRLLRRLFGWMTLISLIFWSGVAWYVVSAQPHSAPPAGYPATVAECRQRWAEPLPYPELRAATQQQCDAYYALLGDRTAPWLERLKAQVVTRLQAALIAEFLNKYQPAPGEIISGTQVVAAVGMQRIAQLLMGIVTQAGDPYEITAKATARCLLDETRRVRAQYDLAMVQTTCAQRYAR